ncbi:MAG TPA: phytanoyl-CoA dioxygenase family protein [Chitinophagales bacterium]|nr:phytanoyl-CoA dioxygenase family protein [Chitinophagales bacterium]
MKELFINEEHQSSFKKDGYIVLEILPSEAITQLQDIYSQTIKDKHKEGLYESSRNNDDETNNYIKDNIQKILTDFVPNFFKEYTLYGGTFMVKSAQTKIEFDIHQDWNIVDEQEHTAVFLWIPLVETNKENGAFYLIKGSHVFFDNYRSGSYKTNMISRRKIDKKHITSMNLKPGQVLVYLPQLFHGSFPNRSDKDRLALIAMLTDKDAPLYCYYKKNDNLANVFQINPYSYLNDINIINNGEIPETATLVDTIPYTHPQIDHKKLFYKLTGKSYTLIDRIRIFAENLIG